MFSSTRFVSSSFLNKFQLHDTLRQIQGVSASGFRRPTKSQRRSLKLFAFRNSQNSNSSPSLLTPKHLPGLLHNNNTNPPQTFFDFQPESFNGIDDSSHNNNNNNSIRRNQENKFAKIQVPKPQEKIKHDHNENANSIQFRIRQVLENPEDDPKTYPADSWERERAEIRRRAKISLIKKDRFMTTYKDRAMQDASKHGVDFNEHLFHNDGVRRNSAVSKEQRFIKQLKKYEIDGFSNVVVDVGSGAKGNSDGHDDDVRNSSNSADYNVHAQAKRLMMFVDLDQKMRQDQLNNEGEESSYDEGEAAFSESHLSPEEIAIKFYNQQHQNIIIQQENDNDDVDGFYNRPRQTQQQQQGSNAEEMEHELPNSNHLDDDSAAYLAVKDLESEFDENAQDSSSSSSYPEFRHDGRPFEKHEKLWELHEKLQKGKINQQDEENPFLTGEARSHPALGSTSSSIHRYETSNLSQKDVESNQKRFNDLLENAIVLFSPPHKDALSTAEMAMTLRRADKNFSPQKYGSPELIFLLRNSCFLMNWKGKWAFLRLFDPEREDVTVKLEKYKFRESPSSDGIRSVPTREIDTKKWN